MPHPGLDLDAIVADATSLRERLVEPRGPETVERAAAGPWLDRWQVAVEPKGTDWFDKRLRWAGLDRSTAAAALTAADHPRALPSWAVALGEISELARRGGGGALDPSPLEADAPLPFEDLLLPAVAVGRAALAARLGFPSGPLGFPLLGVVSSEAYRDLERGLLDRLTTIAGLTLQSEFSRFRPIGRSLSAMLDLPDLDPPASTGYRRFVDHHLRDGWLELLGSHPVLGRLIAVAVELWTQTTAEMIDRLAGDRDEIARTFGFGSGPLRASRFVVGLGDFHRGGRSVAVVALAGGERVVYKPKPLALEVAFNRLIDWCNRRGASPELKVTTVLDRGEYGWVEHLDTSPCSSDAAAERYYRRAGMLLCLLHAVRATDCHFENLIAHGDQPVLIDAETLLYPDPQPLEAAIGPEPAGPAADRLLLGSVLRTGLLPGWHGGADGSVQDRSAFGRLASDAASRDSPRWSRINTDDMDARPGRDLLDATGNVPRIGDRPLSALDYEAQLTEGFESLYRLLMAHRESLRADDGPLAAMRSLSVRFVYRPSRIYGALTASSWRPELLRSGIDWGIHLERLARAFLQPRRKPSAWPILEAEIRAMERMDVPLFAVQSDSADLELDDGTEVRGAFAAPGYDAALELIDSMSAADLDRQLLVIRAALQVKAARAPSGGSDHRPADLEDSAPLPAADLVRAATAIGVEIESHALPDGRGAVNWLGLSYLDDSDRYQLDALGDSLYEGCCGVALFLAALGRATGDPGFSTLALRGVHRLRRTLRDTDPGSRSVVAGALGLGGVSGIGSIIYSLVRISDLLGDDGLVEDAAGLAEWLTPELIASDERLDVMSGCAGALLGLLALDASVGHPQALEAAEDCGRHLLQRRVDANGGRAWLTIGERPLAGFSHGAAGIAYALVRLYGATGDAGYLDAARDGIEFERSVFSELEGNWPDLRPSAGRGDFVVKWCNGAAGVALGRLGCARNAVVAGVERDIESGLLATRERYLQDADFLCCGNLGRAETFLVAAEVTGDPMWRELADRGTASVVSRAAQKGGYRLAAAGPYNPAFFHGTAGIGYQLLRSTDGELPSVLLLE